MSETSRLPLNALRTFEAAAVFWGFILLVIVSPAMLGALILMQV